jgi:hypothetical protein
LVRFSSSFAHRSIWTQGKVDAGGKLAYVSFIGPAFTDDGKTMIAEKKNNTMIAVIE